MAPELNAFGAGHAPFGGMVVRRTDIGTPTATIVEAAGYPRCPMCGSYEVTRHVDFYKVWFKCNRCGAVFGQ